MTLFLEPLTSPTHGATLSANGTYRYALWRVFDRDGPPFVIVGLNPSTADAVKDDPTIRRCVAFAKREGCGRLVMLNLFAYRATDPSVLRIRFGDRIGPDNMIRVMAVLTRAQQIPGSRLVAAWGNWGRLSPHAFPLQKQIPFLCFGTTNNGMPKHPLYLAKSTPLVPL
jgi:hypothetical protein